MTERPLRHLIVSREFPPASYAPGGIGTYAAHIARLLAGAGDTVHVIGERWSGAPEPREELCGGRLVVHRVSLGSPGSEGRELRLLRAGGIPAQRFAWQAGLLAETLIEREEIDVVEAQEWEAPLYYFQLRRSLGLGPERKPPCIVHLHSPTELIYRYNEWTSRPEYVPARRLEEFSIRVADAWLCPSRYLARQVAERYGIPLEAIAVIPYPLGDSVFLSRSPAVWQSGKVLYLGRLEPRKGVIEFVQAAVEVALSDPSASFEFVGDDVRYPHSLTVRRHMQGRIPASLRGRFRFHGVQPRARLPELLAAARVAVVPSRWENFPNSCIEAMASGLPVMASPTGGMTEMLENDVTGWIAETQSPPALAAALRRALATSPEQCAAMGRAASESIRGLCGNEITARRHLAHRREVSLRGSRAAVSPPREKEPDAGAVPRQGLGIVVLGEPGSASSRARDSIANLPFQPRIVTVIGASDASVAVVSRAIRSAIDDHALTGIVLVPGSVALEPGFLEACSEALERNPGLGVLSGWTDRGGAGFVQAIPAFPYQWISDGIGETAVVRAEAFLQADGLREHLPLGYALWDLWNAILVAGWKALAYPGPLATREAGPVVPHPHGPDPALLDALRERFPAEFARDAEAVRSLEALSNGKPGPHIRDVFRLPLREQVSLALDAFRQPRRALEWLKDHWSRAVQ